MIEAGNSSSKERHNRRRSKSLTPPSSPPKTNACELFNQSIGESEQGNTQAESSDYSMAPEELDEQEEGSMDVEFPSIYSVSNSSTSPPSKGLEALTHSFSIYSPEPCPRTTGSPNSVLRKLQRPSDSSFTAPHDLPTLLPTAPFRISHTLHKYLNSSRRLSTQLFLYKQWVGATTKTETARCPTLPASSGPRCSRRRLKGWRTTICGRLTTFVLLFIDDNLRILASLHYLPPPPPVTYRS